MKKIECYLREADIKPLIDALNNTGVGGVTVYPVQGFGRQKGKGEGTLLPKMKVEIIVLEVELERILNTIMSISQKGSMGDGKIAVSPVDDVIRIRTGENGAKALY